MLRISRNLVLTITCDAPLLETNLIEAFSMPVIDVGVPAYLLLIVIAMY